MLLRVLIVEDSEVDELTVVRTLQSHNYDVTYTRVETVAQLDAALQLNFWDVILCDYCLPDFNAVDALQLMQNKGVDIPFIVVSGAINEEMAVGILKAGAHDFVTKARLARLVPAIEREIKEAENRRKRKQAEIALKESKEQLRFVLEASQVGIWDWNIATNELNWSSSCEVLYGLEPGSFAGTLSAFQALVYPEDLALLLSALDYAKQSRLSCYQQEYRIVRPDGSIRWMQSLGNFIYDSSQQPIRMLGVTMDISDRKQAEAKIREQAALLDVATNAICVRDLDKTILYWNQGAERLYGWHSEEVIGRNANDILYREFSPQLQEALQTVVKKNSWQGELTKITKDGKDVIVDSQWSLVRDEAGRPKVVLIVDTDITEKKQLEAKFLRTQRLENLGILASGIAHDLNNILTPILAVAQLLPLTLKNLDSRNQNMLHILETNTKRGADLVKQILTFTRGQKEQHSLVQVKHLLLDIEEIIKGTFPKSIEFKRNIDDNLWVINADATQLHQVFMNLAVNARDAMPNGGVLTVTAENKVIDENYTKMKTESREGNYILVTFADTGVGISPDIIDKIFDPFFTTKEVGKGTGLGLSTVLSIIKNHGGFIEVNSNKKGSVFKVFIPAKISVNMIAQEDLAIVDGNGELILFVDDEKAITEVSKTTLEAHTYQVLTANDGIEAIATYVQNKLKIKAVIIDLMMPSLDGIATIKALLKIKPDLGIIAMSGSDLSEEKSKARECGVQDFLPKPFTANDLLNALHQILAK